MVLFNIRFIAVFFSVVTCVHAAPKYPTAEIPDSVVVSDITIWSDGRALDGSIFRPKNLLETDRVPAIVTSHGWGGGKETAARYAVSFANAGFIVVTFTHNSWGKSQGNVILNAGLKLQQGDLNPGDVHIARNIIDPIDWIHNLRAAIDYIVGEPNVDKSKIGAWGTSFGGGIAIVAAATDDRVKSLVTQVTALPELNQEQLKLAKLQATFIARGIVAPIPEGTGQMPGLDGTPNWSRFLQYNPIEALKHVNVPTLLIAAENESMFKNEEHSGRAHAELSSRSSLMTDYQIIKNIDHYGIYFAGFEQGRDLALNWFDKTLKDNQQQTYN